MSDLGLESDRLKRMDAKTYDATASDFELLTDRYSNGIALKMLSIGEVGAGVRLLDVGTGTGLVARLAAERGADVVGIDHSEGMLARARLKADERGLSGRTSFEAMDAEALQAPDGAFDVVTSLYVLRHLPDARAAAREMHRVLKPGGRLVVSVGARPQPFSASAILSGVGALADRALAAAGRRALSPFFLRDFLSEHGVPPSHNFAAHHGEADVGQTLSSAGFDGIQRTWWGESYHLSPEDFWDVQAVFDSEARERLTDCPDAEVGRLKGHFLERCAQLSRRGVALVYRTGAIIYSAQR